MLWLVWCCDPESDSLGKKICSISIIPGQRMVDTANSKMVLRQLDFDCTNFVTVGTVSIITSNKNCAFYVRVSYRILSWVGEWSLLIAL